MLQVRLYILLLTLIHLLKVMLAPGHAYGFPFVGKHYYSIRVRYNL